MKKIININLSGRVIPIEDSAYEQLQSYIESLRKFFAKEEGRDEIINDIESRIAELMHDKIRKGSSAIVDADIQEIMASMGRPEDFASAWDDEPSTTAQPGQSTFTNAGTSASTATGKKARGRMYRNMDDKFIGGVCSGLANYFNLDPTIVRLLFAIITFGGFGMGFIIYILLWIVIPERRLEDFTGKRLYRNPDDRIIGGVAGGLAAYFKKEAWVIRLIFAAPLILNVLLSVASGAFFHFEPFPSILFGSFSGTFILTYIILWAVLPEARNPYEKMEMRGEKVDLNTIRQNVQEGMQSFKTRAESFSQEVKASAADFSAKAKDWSDTRGKAFVAEVGQTARPIGSGIGRAIGILFKAFFIIIAGSIAFGLFVGLLALIIGGVGIMPLKSFFLNGTWQNVLAWGTIIFFILVPIVAFITWLIRRLIKARSRGGYLGWTFGGMWVLGWICVAFLIASLTRDFRMYERIEEPVSVTQPANDKLTLTVSQPEVRYSGNFWWFDEDIDGWDLSEDTLKIANIKIRILKSEDSLYKVDVLKYSAGYNKTDAENRARQTVFTTVQRDSLLDIGSGFAISKDQKFRGQEVVIEISVPVGKKIRFDESIDEKLHPYSIRMKGNRTNRNYRDYDYELYYDEYFEWDVNVDYIMGEDGKLTDPNKPVTPVDPETRKRQLQERERELEEQRRLIEEEKRKLNDTTGNRGATLQQNNPNELSNREVVDKRVSSTSAVMHSPIMSVFIR